MVAAGFGPAVALAAEEHEGHGHMAMAAGQMATAMDVKQAVAVLVPIGGSGVQGVGSYPAQ